MSKRMMLGLGLVALCAVGAQAELRIAFVNSEVILQEYRAVQGAMETFNRDVESWQNELEQKRLELEALQEELEHQSLMLSEERRREKESEYQRRLTDFEQLKESIWAPDGLIEQRNEELLRPIVSRVQSVLEQLATEEGYDLILDAADSNILYGDPDFDLTTQVLGILNGEEEGQ